MTSEFSWLNNNNSASIKYMKNLLTKVNYTGVITTQTKFQSPEMKDK